MAKPVRYPNGISTAASSKNPLTFFGLPDPTRYITFFEDFIGNHGFPLATSSLASADNWALTVTEGGGGHCISAVGDGNGGILKITTDAGDNDQLQAQLVNETFKLTAGKRTFFKTKFSLTDASANADSVAQAEWYAGLIVRDTDVLNTTAGDGVTDGVFFMSEDGTQNIYLHVQKDATTGQKSTLLADTLTVATQTEFAFYFDGARYIEVYKDGVHKATVDLTATLATYLPDTELAVSFGVKNGEAVAKVFELDYIFCAQER